MKKITGILAISIALLSCNSYYKAITVAKPTATNITENLNHNNRYSILRNGSQAYAMGNVFFTADSQYIQCSLATLPDEHKLHLTNGRRGKMIYKQAGGESDETAVLNEVHFYIIPDTIAVPGSYTTAVNKIQKIEVLEKDKARTAKSHVIGGLIITGIVVVAAATIAASAFASGTWLVL